MIILDKNLQKEIDTDLKEKSKMTPELFIKIRQRIEDLEYSQNRMNLLNGTSVEARNIKIRDKKVIADVYLIFEERTEKHLDVEYNLSKLLEGVK